MTEVPAETIRRAAKKMRAVAEAATPGPWEHPLNYEVTRDYRQDGSRHIATWIATADAGDSDIPDEQATANADHIAGMHPGVALAVAALLDAAARDAALGLEVTEIHCATLDAAHIYLGEADRTYFEVPASE